MRQRRRRRRRRRKPGGRERWRRQHREGKKKAATRTECAICLEDLDDPEFGPAQIRLHAPLPQGVRGGAAEGVQQTCPMCRAKLPDSAR